MTCMITSTTPSTIFCKTHHVIRTQPFVADAMSSFDSVVNTYLIKHCALNPPTSDQIGLVVHSHCDYFAPVGFPAVVDLALRVNKLGKSSVTYEIGVFERGQDDVKAVGEFVHVFVEREGRRPAKSGMANDLKNGLQKLVVDNAML